jgi:hypothetical protein
MAEEQVDAGPRLEDSTPSALRAGHGASGRSFAATVPGREHHHGGYCADGLFSEQAPVFLSSSNIANFAQYMATTAIIAAGEVMVLVCGEVDLSVNVSHSRSL